jgi:hypothetical protein
MDYDNWLSTEPRERSFFDMLGRDAVTAVEQANAELNRVFCSQCGGEFRSEHKTGYSHCADHRGMHNYDND